MCYSEEYVENMTKLHDLLRTTKNTKISLVSGPDHLCEEYPNSGEYHCKSASIYERDDAILKNLNLKLGQVVTWHEIEKRIQKHVKPSII